MPPTFYIFTRIQSKSVLVHIVKLEVVLLSIQHLKFMKMEILLLKNAH